MTDLTVLAILAGSVIVTLAVIIKALLASNKALTLALIAKDGYEFRAMQDTATAKPALRIPFIGRERVPLTDDEDDILPLGLSG